MTKFKDEREHGDVRTLQTVSHELHCVEIAYLDRSEKNEAYKPLLAKLWPALNLVDETLDIALSFADDADEPRPDDPKLRPKEKTLEQKAAAYDTMLARMKTTLQDCYVERESPITTAFELEGEQEIRTLMNFLCLLLTDAGEPNMFEEAFAQKIALDRKLNAWEHGTRVSLNT
jgi:hypothetical protein